MVSIHACRKWLQVAPALVAIMACRGEPLEETINLKPVAPPASDSLSPNGLPELVEDLRFSESQEIHPSDGGGRAWLQQIDGDPDFATASTPGRFQLIYEVGPEGIATGGAIHFQVSPFWDWSTPHIEVPDAPGFTTVSASAEDIELEIATYDAQLLGIVVAGRPLRAGETIRIVYGAGPAGAYADRFAEKNSRFWFAVDGDGDGVRKFLVDSPGIEVRAGPAARLIITLPSVVRPNEALRITVATVDAGGSVTPFEGEVVFRDPPPELELPESLAFESEDAGRKTLEVTAHGAGIVRLRVQTADGLAAESNPMLISAAGAQILWGDLHGHSNLSDGTGTAEDYFRYARDVAALDVIALTDHDHWGVIPLDSHPEAWEEIKAQTRRFHEPGRFVTLLGYEWTSWLHGHRHVLNFGDEGHLYSSLDREYETPIQLWNALRGKPVLTFAHHSAGGPVATNWDYPPDPVLEPLTEIVSVHGSSEALDSPALIYSAIEGNFVRDVLDRGYRFGFVGSGDGHDGHPGLAHLDAGSAGLAAILSEQLTRESVMTAMRERRVYATNGARIILRTALDEHRMGSLISKPDGESYAGKLFVHAIGTAPIEIIDFIRSGQPVDSIAIGGLMDVTLERSVENLTSGEYVYVRVIQEDGGVAWSSPIYIE